MEFYATEDEGPNLRKLSEVLNIIVSRKDKSITVVDRHNPHMMGYPLVSHQKFLKMMLDNGYVVVVTEQVTPPPHPVRKITGVYTSATNIDDTNPNNNFLMTIFLEEVQNHQYVIGMTLLDISTGELFVHEIYSEPSYDEKYPLDEIVHLYTNYQPKEVLIIHHLKTANIDELVEYFECARDVYYCKPFADVKKIYKDIDKLNYQRELLYKIYTDVDKSSHCINQIFETLDLERLDAGRTALCMTLNHVYNNNPNSLSKLHRPKSIKTKKSLYLGNNALQQLDVFKTNDQNSKYDSVYKIVNKTVTHMGSRFLRKQLIEPTYDVDTLNERYNLIHRTKNHTDTLKIILGFNDVEKLYRKIDLCMIHPLDFHVWFENIKQGIEFYKYIDTTFNISYSADALNELIQTIESTFTVDNFNKYLLNDINGPIFKSGIYKNIDILVKNTSICTNYIDVLALKLQSLLNKELKLEGTSIKITSNDRDGHYLTLTSKRAQVLQKILKDVTVLDLGETSISVDSLEFKPIGKGASTKITIPEMKQHSDKLTQYIEQLKILNKEYFIKFLNDKVQSFRSEILHLIRRIAYWDFIYSGTIVAQTYNYTRPEIKMGGKSFIDATHLRHPIIELISQEAYVPTTIQLGIESQDCILLYGLNSAGKSTLQKAIGINIILAQIGYYTAATRFVYNPYQSLLARISSNDNLFKGLSSFALEITELKAILKRSNENTLVIADEVCKGSEHKSSLIIVASIIEILAKNKTSLITASHLHELAHSPIITVLDNVKMYHVHIDFNEETNSIIYNRELRPGSGESFYGLNVAKYLMHDVQFNEVTTRVKHEFSKGVLLHDKWSKYNSALNIDVCQVCKYTPETKNDKPLEVHHIQFQRDADEFGHVNGMHKNHSSNLVVLCQGCHDSIDTGKLIVHGYTETGMGKVLDFEMG
jgi:DNA mismatch repair protein MutS